MLKRIVFNILKFSLFLGIGAALLWVITKDLTEQDRNDIAESFREANYWWVVLSVVIGIISHIFRALRWQMMLKPLGDRKSTHLNSSHLDGTRMPSSA